MELSAIEDKIQVLSLESEKQHDDFKVSGNSEYCYSLLERNSENKEKLQRERLKFVLDQLQREREDASFSRDCLFCRTHITGNRSLLLQHLMEQHNFLIGAPDNIVFIHELLDHLEQMLRDLRCFFCEKVFKDWLTLKEHMRKKQHKRINPQNKNYDRFYIINYLELGKNWKDVQDEDDGVSQEDSEKELMDCVDEDLTYVCLFCKHESTDFERTFLHMKDEHKFDFRHLKEAHHLNFYGQIKLINYIRKKVHEKKCFFCDLNLSFHEELLRHLMETGHSSSLPDSSLWDQPLYYFSTFENDNLLCALDVEDSDFQDCQVYPEDSSVPPGLLMCE